MGKPRPGSRPDLPPRILADGEDGAVGHARQRHALEARPVVAAEPAFRADPQRPVTIRAEGRHEIAGQAPLPQAEGGNLLPLDAAQPRLGADPDRPRPVLRQREDRTPREVFPHAVRLAFAVFQPQEPAAVNARPERPVAGLDEGADVAPGHARGVRFVEDREMDAVETDEPLLRSDPDVAVLALEHGLDGVLGEALGCVPLLQAVLEKVPGGVQRAEADRSKKHERRRCGTDVWQATPGPNGRHPAAPPSEGSSQSFSHTRGGW